MFAEVKDSVILVGRHVQYWVGFRCSETSLSLNKIQLFIRQVFVKRL